jgi:hypothetical protein
VRICVLELLDGSGAGIDLHLPFERNVRAARRRHSCRASTLTQLDFAWQLADTLNALMAVPNLIALLALSPVLVQLTREQLADTLVRRVPDLPVR